MDASICRKAPSRVRSWALLLLAGLIATHASSAVSQSVTKFSYNAGDLVSQVTDPRGLVTSYTYDGLGQKWQQVSPDTGTTRYGYDSYARLTSITRADGSQTTYGYDGMSRRTSVTARGLTQSFGYDSCTHGVGRLCSAKDATGTVSYTYSPEGWVTGRGFAIGGTGYSLGYGYNALGQVTAVAYPDGNQALYTYSHGVVSAVQVKVGGTVSNAATSITYRPGDLGMTQWSSSNGLVNTLNYDTDARLTGISVPGVQSLGLSYDAANRINGLTNGIDGAMSQSFGYDAMSRLTSVYAGADNQAFQYDANGNRTYQVNNGVAINFTVSTVNNQVGQRQAGSQATYGYDPKGNLTTVNGVPYFTYDGFNRMTGANGSTYYVSAEGQRLKKTVGGVSTYFAPDRSNAMLAENNSGLWSDYVWLNGRLIGRINGGQVLAVHDDQVGRPEVMTDPTGTVVWRVRNTAFDRAVTIQNTSALNLVFPGQYYDAESNLSNNGYRDYSPLLGRYVESDPIGLSAGVNTYAYVGSNPLMRIDPYGLDWQVSYQLGGSAIVPGAGASANVAVGINFPSINPLTWSVFASGQAAGGAGGGVFGGVGDGFNVAHGDAPTTGVSSSNYGEADGGWGFSGGINGTWDNCGKTTGTQYGAGVKLGAGFGLGAFVGTAWTATAASPTIGRMLGL